VGPPHRNGSSDPSTRWAERTRRWSGPAFAFAVGLAAPALIAAIAPSFPVESSSVLSLIAALSVPGMAAWNRCTPWLRSAMLGQVVTLTAGWPLPRRSWGWMVLFRLAAQATPDALAAALGVALGCLLVDPGGHGAFLATVVVAGCLPLVAVAVLLATTLMAGDWAAWTVGGMLLALGGPALIQAVPMDRPVQAVAILAVTVVPMLAVATIVQARRIAGREW
jgi:hypothetical protein